MVGRMSGVWTQHGSFAETEGLCDKRTEAMLPEGHRLRERGGLCGLCLDFNCTLSSLQLRKTTGYLSQCSQHVLDIAFCRFDHLSHATCSGLLFPLTFSFHILVSPRSVEMPCRSWGFLRHVTLSL